MLSWTGSSRRSAKIAGFKEKNMAEDVNKTLEDLKAEIQTARAKLEESNKKLEEATKNSIPKTEFDALKKSNEDLRTKYRRRSLTSRGQA